MPLPSNKSEEDFIKECMPIEINSGKDQDQAYAICKSKYDGMEKKPKSKIEIMADIKKIIDKNGYDCNDEKILTLFGEMNVRPTNLSRYALAISPVSPDAFEIKVFPRKKVYIEKCKDYIDLNTALFTEMINNFQSDKLFRPFIDIEHRLGEKFGDIVDLYEKDDGLYARVQPNSQGFEVIKNNIYSYVSPEWGDRVDTDKVLHKNVLWTITLTNIPALESENPKLQDQIRLTKIGGSQMTFREKLSKFEITTKLAADPAGMPEVITEILSTLKEAVAKIEELTGQKEVAEDAAMQAQEALSKIEKEKLSKEKEDFFKEKVSLGQVEIKELEDWKQQYDTSKDFVRKMLDSRPEKSGQKSLTINSESNTELSKDDYAIMEKQGFKRSDGTFDIERYKKDVLN